MSGTVNAGSIIYEVDMDTAKLLAARREVDAALNGMGGSMGRLEASVNRTERSVGSMERSMSSLTGVAKGLLAALSVQQIASYADAWTVLNNKVANSIKQGETQADVMQRIFDISQATQSSMNGTATLYARLERGTRTLNTSTADLAKLTTIINQGFAVSGATAQEAESAIVQLSQGLAAGALRGEEFNSVSEQGSRLMIALADSLGVSLGQLRAMAAQGKLTNDVVVKGLLSQGDAIGKEFAKTTVSISQGLLVAGNNVTKFFGENSTVKSFSAAFRDSVVTMSENLDMLSGALVIVAAVLGGRYAGALAMAAQDKVKLALASRNQAAAELLAAREAARSAAVMLRASAAARDRALAEVRIAEMMKASAYSADAAAVAQQRLIAARTRATAAEAGYASSLAASTAAQAAASAGAGIMMRAMGLVGGPVGAAFLAASAVLYFSQKSEEAKSKANELADSVNELTDKFKQMSHVEIAASIAKMRNELPELKDQVDEAKEAFDETTASVKFHQKEIEKYGTAITRGRQAAEALPKALDDQAIAAGHLAAAQKRLSQTQSAIGLGQAQLNGTRREGIDLLRRENTETGIAAGMMSQLGKAINAASGAKEKFNATSLIVTRPKDIQDYLDGQQDQIDLQSEFNERKREQKKAEMDIRNLAKKGGETNSDQIERDVTLARERAGVAFDQHKAEEARKKAQRESESQDKKSASSAESVAQKLSNLKQQAELAAGSTQELSREQSILRAGNSLGKGATNAQIQEAKDYAAAIWDTTAAIKARNAIPELKENADYTAQKSQLEMLKGATDANGKLLISQEQYNTASEQLEQEHQSRMVQIRAGQAVTAKQQSAGLVDPVQALASEQARKLALIQAFEKNKTLTQDQALALRNAAETQYEKQRIAAQWEIWRNQDMGNEAVAASFDALAGNASNALTGMITGSMSASDAMRSLGSTVLNSLVNTFVQMGVEWVKSAIMGSAAQQTAIAATTAAQVAGTATTTATSTAAAGTTLAAWLPAALVASVGSFGAAAIIGGAALASAFALSSVLGRKNGGPVSAGNLYEFGEGNLPEMLQMGGKNYMLPGNNGRVFSNKDSTGAPTIPKASTGMERLHQSNSNSNSNSNNGSQGGINNVTIVIENHGTPQQIVSQSAEKGLNQQDVIRIIVRDAYEKGPGLQAVMANTTATPRLGG